MAATHSKKKIYVFKYLLIKVKKYGLNAYLSHQYPFFSSNEFPLVNESDIYAISPALYGETMAGQRQDGRGQDPVVMGSKDPRIKRSLIIVLRQ